jgi:hypothetical protein
MEVCDKSQTSVLNVMPRVRRTNYAATFTRIRIKIVNLVSGRGFHASVLCQMGRDHTRLTFRHTGHDMHLPDVHGNASRRSVPRVRHIEGILTCYPHAAR